MKLLFDQNLSRKLVALLSDLFPGSTHLIIAGLAESDDADVWDYASRHGFVIVSKDDDFHQRSFLEGHPPKVIMLTLGNCSTELVEATLRSHIADIHRFETDDSSVLVIP